MKEQLIKIVLFLVIIFAAKTVSSAIFFIAEGVAIIAFWGTWLRQDKTQPIKKWNDLLNYIGLMCIVTGVSRLF